MPFAFLALDIWNRATATERYHSIKYLSTQIIRISVILLPIYPRLLLAYISQNTHNNTLSYLHLRYSLETIPAMITSTIWEIVEQISLSWSRFVRCVLAVIKRSPGESTQRGIVRCRLETSAAKIRRGLYIFYKSSRTTGTA